MVVSFLHDLVKGQGGDERRNKAAAAATAAAAVSAGSSSSNSGYGSGCKPPLAGMRTPTRPGLLGGALEGGGGGGAGGAEGSASEEGGGPTGGVKINKRETHAWAPNGALQVQQKIHMSFFFGAWHDSL